MKLSDLLNTMPAHWTITNRTTLETETIKHALETWCDSDVMDEGQLFMEEEAGHGVIIVDNWCPRFSVSVVTRVL